LPEGCFALTAIGEPDDVVADTRDILFGGRESLRGASGKGRRGQEHRKAHDAAAAQTPVEKPVTHS
jgi:hypothetical protein